eukprot:CAMPEP_0198138912 /NCGR_PEP_ID=MMETSP1443-20131203/2287_1 /TAXON_ID=186043 /ORGANISM="Entomoneis sp., Strain CCMP2396" /LENGTH=661 /DNA_ID=CAMNT_0043800869 /DNA_START=245 /DNA_END=2230 /DNA_ORIENTATION=-
MLQYDNSAFYFFAMSILSFYLLPSWYYILSTVYKALMVKDDSAVARTLTEKKKADQLKIERQGWTKMKSSSFVTNTVITVLLTALFVFLVISVSQDGQVNSFDPFSILEIDLGADNKVIKKAYRRLSLIYHPDKNPGDRAAEAKFVMVSKAYEALTDETARENYEKFGNPDGQQNMQVAIGLPAFLLDSDNRNLVLVGYLIIMVGVIPYAVYTYYADSSKYGEKDVMYDTYAWFHYALSEHSLIKALPEVLAGSAEFRKANMPTSQEEKQSIAKQMTMVKQHMVKPKYNHAVCVKGNVLMHSHVLRQTDAALTTKDQADLKFMLQSSTSLIDAMISVCKSLDAAQTAINCIEFGQYVTQAMWVKDSPLLQLPHYGPEEIKHATTTGKSSKTISTMQDYMAQDEDDRKGMKDFSDEQKSDVRKYLKIYPDITVETKVFVDDDEDDKVYEGDISTIQVTITRNNFDADIMGDGGLVHAPLFPFPKREAWWIILAQIKEGKIMSIEKVSADSKIKNGVVTHNIKMMAPPVGRYEFDLVVKSNGYVGCDYSTRLAMETLDKSALPEYKVHPEDADLDEEPTLFEQLLNDHVEEDSDEEEDDDGDDDKDEDDDNKEDDAAAPSQEKGNIPQQQKAAKKRAQLRNARNNNDDDDDSDDESAEDVTPK